MLPKDLIAASSRPLILSILQEQESYGYAILQRVRELSEKQIEWTDGMLYPVLHRLETEDLIVSEWKTAESGRERKYYRITPAGRTALRGARQQWLVVHETLAKLWTPLTASI